jgi:hypothetical protein
VNENKHRDGPDDYNKKQYASSRDDEPMLLSSSASTTTPANYEVSVQNPTQLFHLMNRHLWAQALKHLQLHPSDARVWITSSSSSLHHSRNLPLHLACLMLRRGEAQQPPLHFIEALVRAYPDAAAEPDLEGNLPLHLASEYIDISSRYLESEGILLLLSKTYPAGLKVRDKEGRVPLQILEQRGLTAYDGKIEKSGLIRYMKSQTKSKSTETESDGPSSYNSTTFVMKKKMLKKGTTPINSAKDNRQRMPTSTSNLQSRMTHEYNLLSTPSNNHGYHLMSTPANNIHLQPSTLTPPRYDKELREFTNSDDTMDIHTSPLHSEYMLLSPNLALRDISCSRRKKPTIPQNDNELRTTLRKLEAKYAQLLSEFEGLKSIHSETLLELKEQIKGAEESQYKMKMLNESEKTQKRLNSDLEAQKKANIHLEEKLSQQLRLQVELKEELNERTNQLHEMRIRESSLLQKLLKKLDNDEDRIAQDQSSSVVTKEDSLAEKNILLREVALKAIKTVGLLQRDNSTHLASKHELEQLLQTIDLESTPNRASSRQQNSHIKANESLKMMHPIIKDALDMQNEVTKRVRKLLQMCKISMRLVDGIQNIPEKDFNFEETLQTIELVMTNNIGLVPRMDTLLDAKTKIVNRIASVTNQSLADINVSAPKEHISALLEIVEITEKTSKKLEGIAKTISQLDFGKENLKEEDMRKYIKAADEITKVFQLSLDHLAKGAKKTRDIADAAINANK